MKRLSILLVLALSSLNAKAYDCRVSMEMLVDMGYALTGLGVLTDHMLHTAYNNGYKRALEVQKGEKPDLKRIEEFRKDVYVLFNLKNETHKKVDEEKIKCFKENRQKEQEAGFQMALETLK